ncbi:cell division protein ZapA [bacterium]|nr:cell division protein ZapA [bacterium]MBU1599737.1 cell division protein ZapA [bacterium]
MNKVSVQIMGQGYNLLTDEPTEKVEKIAKYIDSKMMNILKRAPSLPKEKVAILSSLEIVEELLKEKESIHKKIASLIHKIDTSLA